MFRLHIPCHASYMYLIYFYAFPRWPVAIDSHSACRSSAFASLLAYDRHRTEPVAFVHGSCCCFYPRTMHSELGVRFAFVDDLEYVVTCFIQVCHNLTSYCILYNFYLLRPFQSISCLRFVCDSGPSDLQRFIEGDYCIINKHWPCASRLTD